MRSGYISLHPRWECLSLQRHSCAVAVDFIPTVQNSIMLTTSDASSATEPHFHRFRRPTAESQYIHNARCTTNLTRWNTMGLSWQQGPLSTGATGRFLVPE